jgi:DNA-binding transcriptional LysR family regulator
MLMTFGQLEIFAMLAETQGFTSAAARLGISQSAVSHALKGLEDELGVKLFDRGGSGVELTQIGARLLARGREINNLSAAMKQEALDFQGVQIGTLRIGSFGATSSLQLLPDLMDEFAKDYPGIDVLIEEAADEQVIEWIEERRIDLGFVVLPDDRLQTFPLTQDEFVALVPKGSPLAAQSTIRLDQLCDAPFIMPESGSAHIISRLFAAENLQPNVRFRTSQVLSTIMMVARGQGVSLVADLVLPPETGSEGWVKKGLSPPRMRPIGLAMHKDAIASPAATAFLKTAEKMRIRKCFKREK